MDVYGCRLPEWVTGGQFLELPCQCELSLERLRCDLCEWYMPDTPTGTAPGNAGTEDGAAVLY